MINEEKEKISQILASEDRQIEVDTIRIMEENDVRDKEKAHKIVKKHLENQRKRILSS